MENECFKCGISGEVTRLFDAISEKGIVRMCKDCLSSEDVPVIQKPTTFQLKDAESKRGTTYERLSLESEKPRISHIKNKNELSKKQDVSLRDIVERTFEPSSPRKSRPRPDLIPNFHWVLMRARRFKKITAGQLAKEIAESEAAIKLAEKGILPEDDNRLINKLESFLGVKVKKESSSFPLEMSSNSELKPKTLRFDPATTKQLTIADLRKMKEDKKGNSETNSEEESSGQEEEEENS